MHKSFYKYENINKKHIMSLLLINYDLLIHTHKKKIILLKTKIWRPTNWHLTF